MGKLLPVILALAGILGGGAAGYVLRPAPDGAGYAPSPADPAEEGYEAEAEAAASGAPAASGHAAPEAEAEAGAAAETGEGGTPGLPEYVKLSNQFVVPVVEDGRVAAMVILSLTLEVAPGSTEGVYAREPRLRDAFLQVLFDHANAGGFRGSFTDGANLVLLRRALTETAQRLLPGTASDVLIADIVRQDS